MLRSLSFNEAFEFQLACHSCFGALEPFLGEAGMEVLSDAVNFFAQNPQMWGCNEDGDYAALMALELHRCGFNHLLPEHDVTLKFLIGSKSRDGEST